MISGAMVNMDLYIGFVVIGMHSRSKTGVDLLIISLLNFKYK